jgi:hypothetical protein
MSAYDPKRTSGKQIHKRDCEVHALDKLGSMAPRFNETRSETRTRLIKVVPKNEKKVGVPHWNSARHPINVR